MVCGPIKGAVLPVFKLTVVANNSLITAKFLNHCIETFGCLIRIPIPTSEHLEYYFVDQSDSVPISVSNEKGCRLLGSLCRIYYLLKTEEHCLPWLV